MIWREYKMNTYDYLVQNMRNVFWPWEHNHILDGMYTLIRVAARENASRIIVIPERIYWENDAGGTGELTIDTGMWRIDFISEFRKIFKRDRVIRKCLKIVQQSEIRVECELISDVE